MPIPIKTSAYEGPLDLLLELIEKRKLLINDIALASVTEEYITRINSMQSLPVGEVAEFISLAAMLLLIKSRSLLPTLTLSEDESRDIKELEYRLAVYQLLKDAARGLNTSLKNPALYEGNPPQQEPIFLPDASVTSASLLAATQTLIAGFPQHLLLPKVQVKQIVSLEEMITRLGERVTKAMSLSFKEFSGFGKKEKQEVIVSFLALLELVKQGIITATQQHISGDIMLQSDAISTPSL